MSLDLGPAWIIQDALKILNLLTSAKIHDRFQGLGRRHIFAGGHHSVYCTASLGGWRAGLPTENVGPGGQPHRKRSVDESGFRHD